VNQSTSRAVVTFLVHTRVHYKLSYPASFLDRFSCSFCVGQELSDLCVPKATVVVSYRQAACKVINEENSLKRHGNLLKILLPDCYKQAYILLNSFL
jgi:hypothetical protein